MAVKPCAAKRYNKYSLTDSKSIIIIIVLKHEFGPRWPVSVSAFTSSSTLFLDRRLVWLWWGLLMTIGMPC
jgi:hypothetical protein